MSHRAIVAVALLLTLLSVSCAGKRALVAPSAGATERGVASWYGPDFHGRATASGEKYDMHAMTAAHRTLPFGTRIEVRNLANGRRVEVVVNDRGPFVKDRVVDLSYAAAQALGMIGPGTAHVELSVVAGPPQERFRVQVGAFRDRDNALELKLRLDGEFPDVRLESSDGWHRVSVGPVSGRERARSLASELRRQGLPAVILSWEDS